MLKKKLNKEYHVYNRTFNGEKQILYPKNYFQIIKNLTDLKKNNITPLIISGKCGHGDKSYSSKNHYIISLRELKKIIKIDTKQNIVKVQAGVNLYKLFEILQRKKYMIFNIPGGKKISVGGAVSGNVHGRPQENNFNVFGDNVTYIKYIDKNFKIKIIHKKNIKIRKLIGSFGLFGIIIEVGLKIFKINFKSQKKIEEKIYNIKDFKKFESEYKSFYGYINFFNKKKFIGNFISFPANSNKYIKYKKKIDLFYFINIFKLDILISFIINKYTLKIFYFLIFNLKNIFFFNKKKISYTSLEESLYFVNINNYLPYYFKKGMIEIQFSVKKEKFFKIIHEIKNEQFKKSVFPLFFIIKKMQKTKDKYFFDFPKYNYCISLGYKKSDLLINKIYFKKLYEIIFKNKGNIYLTKDETVLDLNSTFKKKLKKKITITSSSSNDFYDKII
jgi:UDP-N-acetylenolpyruvoylglucosamine reductase